MKLVSMVDYVIKNTKPFETIDDRDYYREILISYGKMKNYAKFLKQPLKLEMFVPCDDEVEPLENKSCPVNCDQGDFHEEGKCFKNGCVQKAREYEKAQEKVLFKGFGVKHSEVHDYLIITYKGESYIFDNLLALSETIEGLLKYLSELELTENAIKQLK